MHVINPGCLWKWAVKGKKTAIKSLTHMYHLLFTRSSICMEVSHLRIQVESEEITWFWGAG